METILTWEVELKNGEKLISDGRPIVGEAGELEVPQPVEVTDGLTTEAFNEPMIFAPGVWRVVKPLVSRNPEDGEEGEEEG